MCAPSRLFLVGIYFRIFMGLVKESQVCMCVCGVCMYGIACVYDKLSWSGWSCNSDTLAHWMNTCLEPLWVLPADRAFPHPRAPRHPTQMLCFAGTRISVKESPQLCPGWNLNTSQQRNMITWILLAATTQGKVWFHKTWVEGYIHSTRGNSSYHSVTHQNKIQHQKREEILFLDKV